MFPFTFHIADSEIQVKLGPLVVRRIRYSEIEAIELGYKFWNEHWTNPWPLSYLTIRKSRGFIKNMVINPRDREKFAAEIRTRIEK